MVRVCSALEFDARDYSQTALETLPYFPIACKS